MPSMNIAHLTAAQVEETQPVNQWLLSHCGGFWITFRWSSLWIVPRL